VFRLVENEQRSPGELRVQGSGFRVQGSGFRVQDTGFDVYLQILNPEP